MSGGPPLSLPYPPTGTTYVPEIPNSIAAFEAKIVERLKSQINMIEIAHYPDKPETYVMKHRVGTALVIYRGSTFGKTVDMSRVMQERDLQWEIVVEIRDLGWAYGGPISGTSPGAYQVLDALRRALIGFKPKGAADKIRATREQFLHRDKDGGTWLYALGIAFTTMAIEAVEDVHYPLLQEVTQKYSDGGTPIETVDTPGPQTPPDVH
jgi:hypothetical protein